MWDHKALIMDLQYQLRATRCIRELPEINGKFVRTAGWDLRLLHKEELGNLCMTSGREVWSMGGHCWLCDSIISRGEDGFPLGSSPVGLSLHVSIQG